jgi:hypothetical protein
MLNNRSVATTYLEKVLTEDVEDIVSFNPRFVLDHGGIFRAFFSCFLEEFIAVL